ncbi:MAG: M14 family metallopeptidase [Myxococcota bacterium]
MTNIFSDGYVEARARLLGQIDRFGLGWSRLAHPDPGPDGEELTTDVVQIGPRDASTAIVVVSGTHGVEGFLGSALQQHILEDQLWNRTPYDVRWVLIHAINPWGYAWLRRVTEDNVDLNRNFVDFDDLPDNDEYTRLADALAPDDLHPSTLLKADETLWAFAEAQGQVRLQEIITRGQYDHPMGLYYGGQEASWSQTTFRSIVEHELSHASRVYLVDVHTGLGAYGASEIIVESPRASAIYQRAQRIWNGRVRSSVDGESLSPKLSGAIDHAVVRLLPHAEVTPVALEVGTRSPLQVLQALRADNWLHTRGDPKGRAAAAIKEQIRDAFYPDEGTWKERALAFASDTLDDLLKTLA